jgi:hypothetical protein
MDRVPLFFSSYSGSFKGLVVQADYSFLHHEYEVLLEIKKENCETRIEYTTVVKFEKFFQESLNPVISIQRLTPTFINGIESDFIPEKISVLAGSIFQPLLIELNSKGEAIQISDYESILKKWQKATEDLQKYYAGQLIVKYIENINQALKSPKRVLEKLRNDWFLSLYFIPLYTEYKHPPEKEPWKLPSILKGEESKVYSVFKSYENLQDLENSVLISVQDLNDPNIFTAIYSLDNKTKLIKNIEATVAEKDGYTLRAKIQCIKTHKKQKENTPIPEKKKDFDEEAAWQKYLRKKKGFWGRLFDE